MPRAGLNTILSYPKKDGTSAIRLRTNIITYDVRQIAAESQGRTYRTFYPHIRTQTQFGLGVLLKGRDEYETMNNWFAEYAKYALSYTYEGGLWPIMKIDVEVQNFHRTGVPTGVFEWGDRVGAMLWTPMIGFETASEPGDKEVNISQFDDITSKIEDPNSAYFYPSGKQLKTNENPVGNFPTAPKVVSLMALQSAANQSAVLPNGISIEETVANYQSINADVAASQKWATKTATDFVNNVSDFVQDPIGFGTRKLVDWIVK